MRAAQLLMKVGLSATDGDARGAARADRGGAGVAEGTR
jgi:hypothetical protein